MLSTHTTHSILSFLRQQLTRVESGCLTGSGQGWRGEDRAEDATLERTRVRRYDDGRTWGRQVVSEAQ